MDQICNSPEHETEGGIDYFILAHRPVILDHSLEAEEHTTESIESQDDGDKA
jgi:hypothetical protein